MIRTQGDSRREYTGMKWTGPEGGVGLKGDELKGVKELDGQRRRKSSESER